MTYFILLLKTFFFITPTYIYPVELYDVNIVFKILLSLRVIYAAICNAYKSKLFVLRIFFYDKDVRRGSMRI